MADETEAGVRRLDAEALARRVDPDGLGFSSTADIEPVDGLIGQERAVGAVRFASRVRHEGFNLFVVGPPGSGKHDGVGKLLEKQVEGTEAPPDWIYVHNFQTAHQPRAIALPPGRARAFGAAMDELIEDLRTSIQAMFESEDIQNRQESINSDFRERQEKALEELNQEAREDDVAILRTPSGFAMAPTRGGQVLKPEEFNALPEERRKEFEQRISELQEKLEAILKSVPRWEKERRHAFRELGREVATLAVSGSIDEVKAKFAGIEGLSEHLDDVREDMVQNVGLFLEQGEGPMPMGETGVSDGRFDRYRANVFVARDQKQAPVVRADHPSIGNLIGRVEHIPQQGALVTNFRLIKSGALHQANGGFLLVDARSLLMEPFAYTALKRALRTGCIRIESPAESLGVAHTVTLQPEPIPLDVKVVLFGDRMLHYLMMASDPDVAELFKVAADFDDDTPWDDEAQTLFARAIATVARSKNLRALDAPAVARTIEQAGRLAADAERLSLRIGPLADVLIEADHLAGEAGADVIGRDHVQAALDARRHRAGRIRLAAQDSIRRGIVLIDTEGDAVGQINGLSVASLGAGSFGRPSRITASVRMGTGKLVDIEREVKLGGPLHSKGVLILSGYLMGHFAPGRPMSLSASLVFEQSYGGVDGDSASSAELYALLSALSGLPIRQSLAVTGSVNQYGEVQAIGGVNEKIEGYFETCAARGLTGEQGVLIPASNVQHLMLRDEVVEAVQRNRFHVYPVSTIDEGITLLTGRVAGERGEDGLFPEDSVNRLVEDRLGWFAEQARRFARQGPRDQGPRDQDRDDNDRPQETTS